MDIGKRIMAAHFMATAVTVALNLMLTSAVRCRCHRMNQTSSSDESVEYSMSEGIPPMEAGESAEVSVVGVDLCLILHCDGGDMGVGHHIRANAGRDKIPPEVGQVVSSGVNGYDVGKAKPLENVVNRVCRSYRTNKHPGMSHQPYKTRRHDPGDADPLYAVDQLFPPTSGGVVIGRSVVVGIDKQIDVRDYQFALGSTKASASSWSLI